MRNLRKRHIGLIEDTDLSFQRYLIDKLPWEQRLLGIKGSRGVGKTTMLLQYIKQNYALSDEALYISLDDLYFTENKLIDLAEDFISVGGEHLFIDEVHKYKNWSVEIKNIYDYFKKLKIVFTGSSLLEILSSRSDLSRRALIFDMQGLSFREFINLELNADFNEIKFSDLLGNHTEIALNISKEIKPLKYFDTYLKTGYFPFFKQGESLYYIRLQEILNMIIEIELPLLRNTDISIVRKIQQMLYIISQSVPFKPNISALSNKINTTRKTILEYINHLNDANVFNILHKDTFGISILQKPDKLYLENTNFAYAISYELPNIGSIRETFFLNQLLQNHQVTYPDKGDFLVDNKYLFEIGGKNKTGKQITGVENAFIAADNIEYGYDNKIPLWLFGFLY